jgi:hypothetical protein
MGGRGTCLQSTQDPQQAQRAVQRVQVANHPLMIPIDTIFSISSGRRWGAPPQHPGSSAGTACSTACPGGRSRVTPSTAGASVGPGAPSCVNPIAEPRGHVSASEGGVASLARLRL